MRKARDNGTLQGWWQCAIGDVRTLLAAARHGEDVEENLDMAYATLEHLRSIVDDRIRNACSCEGSKSLEQSLSLLNRNLYGTMMDILLSAVFAEGDFGTGSPLTGQITLALRLLPTVAEIGKLAPEIGYVPVTDVIPEPMVRQDAPTGCRCCS